MAESRQVKTGVEEFGPGAYEVDFGDDCGRTYASLGFNADRVTALRNEPAVA